MVGESYRTPQGSTLPQIRARYRIERELGRGGVGAVYLAHELASERAVALKTLEVITERTTMLFEREYHVLASLRHPSVIHVFDFGFTDDGHRYYTMEVLPGEDIASLSPLPWQKACLHVRDIAASLSLLHCRRLLHRDVSPRNIRLDAHGRAKLIDFGALTSFGVQSDLVGTPACIAPEAVCRGELDQRSDLFSLGVVFYFVLTGRRPFAVKTLNDVEAAMQSRPAAPSTVVADIPPALDQLVLSMIHAEPSGRTSSAAEVFERVSAIAGVSDEAGAEVAQSHLVSTTLCGREREQAQLEQHVEHASRGQGGVVVVEGASGMGKSRLVSGALLAASLRGLTTLRIDAMAHTEPLGVMRALASSLIEQAPAEAKETLGTHYTALLAAFPELRQPMHSRVSAAALGSERGPEQLATIQNQLVAWTLSIASRKTLLIAVDETHAADPTSLGALSALAHKAREARVLLLTTQLLGQPLSLQTQQLARLGARIKLRALSQSAIAELVGSAFGDALNAARLSQWLFNVGQGNPGQSIELLTHLMTQRVIRYSGGAWVLPSTLADEALPTSREHALRMRISALEPVALRLARLSALHRGSLLTHVFARAMRDVPREAFFMALDLLSTRQLVVVTGEHCRIGDDALRTILLDGVPAERIAELHRALGEALWAGISSAENALDYTKASTEELLGALQAGFHFTHGGEGERGRTMLLHGGIELTHRGAGLSAAIPALERAAEAYVDQGRSEYERAGLLVPLTLAGTYVDFRLTYKYGDSLMQTLADITGISLARKLRWLLGKRLGLLVGFVIAVIRFPLTSRRHAARSFQEAVLGIISMGSAIVGASTSLLDGALARRTVELLEPLSIVPRFIPARTAYEFQLSLLDCTLGDFARSRSRAIDVLASLRRKSALLPETARLQLEFGVFIVLSALDAYRTDGSLHATLEALERYKTSVSLQTAAGARATYHAFRGERVLLERYRREVDVLAAQLGSTWRQDVLLARNLWWSHALCEDIMGLKQCLHALEAFARDAPSLAASRDAAAALYLASRGQHHEALAKYGPILEAASATPNELTTRFAVALAKIERSCGHPERAEKRCREALAALTEEQLEFEVAVHGARVEQVLALVDLQRHGEALALLERMLEAQTKHDNPLIRGLNHKAAARVALAMKNADEVDEHLGAMREWFTRSENPSLIAQYHTLVDECVSAGVLTKALSFGRGDGAHVPAEAAAVRELLSRCRGAADRLQTALDVIVVASRAEKGYLYLAESDGGFRFAAPLVGVEPPDALRQELRERLLELLANDETETAVEPLGAPAGLCTVIEPDDDAPMACSGTYQAIFLLVPEQERLVAVGAVALIPGEQRLTRVERSVVSEISRAIYDAADVQTVYVDPGAARHGVGAPSEPGGAGL